MPGSRAESRGKSRSGFGRLIAIAVVGGLLVGAAQVSIAESVAQTPKSLLPTAPLSLGKGADGAGSGSGSGGQTGGKSGVLIDRLNPVVIENIGTLGPESGGFPPDMWGETPRPSIKRMVQILPAISPTHISQVLRRRLLLTAAASSAAPTPESESESSAVLPDGDSLLADRIRGLFTAGDIVAAGRLSAIIPASYVGETLARLDADAALAANDIQRACGLGEGRVALSEAIYWQKLLIFCQAVQEDWQRVEFGLRLLVEVGEEDATFFALMRYFGGPDSASTPSGEAALDVGTLRPLDLAMALQAGAALPVGDPAVLPPWALWAYISYPKVSAELRIAAAERAEQIAIADIEALARLYDGLAIDPALLAGANAAPANAPATTESGSDANPDAKESAEAGPIGRVALYRAAQAQTSALGRTQAIKQARDAAAPQGRLVQMARLYAPMIREVEPVSGLGWFAADAALLHVAVGDHEAARLWIGFAEREAAFTPEARTAWLRAWPAIRLASGEALIAQDMDRLAEWRDWVREEDPAAATARITLLTGLLAALGEPAPPEMWRDLVVRAHRPATPIPGLATLRALQHAASAGHLAETVSLALITLGGDAVGQTSPVVGRPSPAVGQTSPLALLGAVEALMAVGLETEARQLAFEIAVAAGL